MSEKTYKSAGVFGVETDLSTPTVTGPTGIPAGVIGTADGGPAFVPLTVGSYDDYRVVFGGATVTDPTLGRTSPTLFGPLAVYTYLQTAQSLTYLRVLGVGDGKKRSTGNGKVTRAGFTVGSNLVQSDGILGVNPHSVATGDMGRTYFLGCFMSESNGSTVFSESGIQQQSTHAAGQVLNLNGFANGDSVGITVPQYAGGSGVQFKFKLDNSDTTGEAGDATDQLGIGISAPPSAAAVAAAIVAFINDGTVSGITADGAPTSATAPANYTNGVAGITAAVTDTDKITITASNQGQAANSIAIANISGDVATATSLPTIGQGGAVPILRGVVMAASGVILQLSGAYEAQNSSSPSYTDPAILNAITIKGSATGSVNLTNQKFVMLLNGFKPHGDYTNTFTGSFDMRESDYFANKMNKDPSKLQDFGYYLYSHYDVESSFTAVTGSSVLGVTKYLNVGGEKHENIAFILTGSSARDATVASVSPNYESFEDRFTHAKTPFFISQDYGGTKHDLFRIHARGDGQSENSKYKISIQNIIPPSENATYKYGTFDVLVRNFSDADEDFTPLEAWLGCNLDPSSEKYIARVIGDKYVFFDFDQATSSQKLVVKGDHSGGSSRIRVEIPRSVELGNVPKTSLPIGFRGPDHLVISGSGPLAPSPGGLVSTEFLKSLNELPIRYRRDIKKPTKGTSPEIGASTNLYWGVQFRQRVKDSLITDAFGTTSLRYLNDPQADIDSSMKYRTRFFPQFHPTGPNFSVGNNPGTADVNGTIFDCDRFNNNIFTLERIRIKTGSSGNVADPEMWSSASYIRNGTISPNYGLRAFKVSDLRTQGNRTYAKYSVFMQGGFDGTNTFDVDKADMNSAACKREIDDSTNQGGISGPTTAAYRKAIDIMGVKSDVDIQLLAIPGIRNAGVVDYAMTAIENRFDALYVMDIEQRDKFNKIMTSSKDPVTGLTLSPSVTYTSTGFGSRALDNSFSAAYFPDVNIDIDDGKGIRRAPPSVGVLGSIAQGDSSSGKPYLAPAGYSRATLSSAVTGATMVLEREDLDKLYEERINPIATFAGNSPVVWGQKTLMMDPSALDRINVRRLLIYIRRKVKQVANSLLFEPNREETLDKFNALVKPIMQRVQDGGGVDRFKVIIDATTTTQADVENNTIRGKIYLQPTRTAEFIALDFTVTNAGNFDDV